MHQIENKHSFHQPKLKPKDTAYNLATLHRQQGDIKAAENYAIDALKLGSENLAPQLLADIAMDTESKNVAMTLASYYYYQRKDIQSGLEWANKAIIFGSKRSAKNLIAEIEAHQCAAELHEKEVLRY